MSSKKTYQENLDEANILLGTLVTQLKARKVARAMVSDIEGAQRIVNTLLARNKKHE